MFQIFFRLNFDPETKEFSPIKGVDIETRDFGNTTTVEFLDPAFHSFDSTVAFYPMVQHFVDLGYVRGETVRAAPYDWRYAAGE